MIFFNTPLAFKNAGQADMIFPWFRAEGLAGSSWASRRAGDKSSLDSQVERLFGSDAGICGHPKGMEFIIEPIFPCSRGADHQSLSHVFWLLDRLRNQTRPTPFTSLD